jgi:homospermidine synthase
VAISAVSAALWAIRNPRRGFCLPDDIDHDEILKTCYPYLGPFVNEAVDWIPQKINAKLMPINFSTVPEEDLWQFTTFKIDDQQKPPRRQPPVPPHPVTRI